MKIKININFKVNPLIRTFILVDLALLAGWGLIQPVFSVYIIRTVEGATLTTLGIGAAIYWILKSILQIPIANHLDRHEGEKDDFHALVAGLLIAALSAFTFILITRPWHLYLVEAIHAVAFALYIPAWSAIFSRHVDKNRVSFDWSLDSTAVGLSAGVSGIAGGMLAEWIGFPIVFVLAAIFTLIAAFILISFPELIVPQRTGMPNRKDHTPTALGT